MKLLTTIKGVISIAILSLLPSVVLAIPITFEFTGTINNTVLISRTMQTLTTTHPHWNGQQVTGTATIDIPALAASPYNDASFSQYSTSEDAYPYADWMSFSVTNPDGSILDISDSIPVTPAPDLDGDNAYTSLAHQSDLHGGSVFYAQRIYNNYVSYPRGSALLSLGADGDNAQWLTSSADYNDVIIKPEFANVDNLGWIYQLTDAGTSYEYFFMIDSVKRKSNEVPEPSLLLMFISGLLLLKWKRHQ